jgi:hypothetical protein
MFKNRIAPSLAFSKHVCAQVKEGDPPLFGERFSFQTDNLVTSAAAKRAGDKGTTTLCVAPAHDLNPKPV